MDAKLRSDLEIRPEQNSGVIVKDPLTRRFYRFTPVQASVLELLDGHNEPHAIAAEASRRHGTTVTEEQVKEFIGKLRELLLLDHPYCWAKLGDTAKTGERLSGLCSPSRSMPSTRTGLSPGSSGNVVSALAPALRRLSGARQSSPQ